MSLGLIVNLLGGGKTQAAAPATTNTATSNSNVNINSLISAFNSAYQSGVSAGRNQGGMNYTNANANANASANVNIGLYGGGYMVPSLVNNVYGYSGSPQGLHTHDGQNYHTHGDSSQSFQSFYGTQGQGNNGVQASRPMSMAPVNMQPSYSMNISQSAPSMTGSMPAVLPGLSVDQTSQLLAGLGMGQSPAQSGHSAHASTAGSGGNGGLLGGLLGGGGDSGLLGGLGGVVTGLLGGILGKNGLLGATGLGQIVGMPLGLFSGLVGHDSAGKAAANGDVMGWLVNTLDHTGHSHALGGAAGHGSSAPLAILGTIGQEAGGLVGLDKLFGSAQAYDVQNGTNYAAGGSSQYGMTGGLLGGLLGGGQAAGGHGTQSAGNGGLLGGLLNII